LPQFLTLASLSTLAIARLTNNPFHGLHTRVNETDSANHHVHWLEILREFWSAEQKPSKD